MIARPNNRSMMDQVSQYAACKQFKRLAEAETSTGLCAERIVTLTRYNYRHGL